MVDGEVRLLRSREPVTRRPFQVRDRENDDLVRVHRVRESEREPRQEESANGEFHGRVWPERPRLRLLGDDFEGSVDLLGKLRRETCTLRLRTSRLQLRGQRMRQREEGGSRATSCATGSGGACGRRATG